MNIDDEVDRRLLRTARELRAVPIEPPPLPSRHRRSAAGAPLMATLAVAMLAAGGAVIAWGELRSPGAPLEIDAVEIDAAEIDAVETAGAATAAPVSPGPAPASAVTVEPAPTRRLLDGYDEVAMINGVAISNAPSERPAAPTERPLPPGVV